MMCWASRTGTRRNLDALGRHGWGLLISRAGVWRVEEWTCPATGRGGGMKPTACHMPAPAPRSEAEIYRSIRDVVIRSHCERNAGPHQCAGAITITRTHITLNCRLCGDLRQTLASAE